MHAATSSCLPGLLRLETAKCGRWLRHSGRMAKQCISVDYSCGDGWPNSPDQTHNSPANPRLHASTPSRGGFFALSSPISIGYSRHPVRQSFSESALSSLFASLFRLVYLSFAHSSEPMPLIMCVFELEKRFGSFGLATFCLEIKNMVALRSDRGSSIDDDPHPAHWAPVTISAF